MTKRWTRLLVGPLVAAAASFMALGAGTASASPGIAQYGPGACTASASVSPSTVAPGGKITVTISGTCANETFTVTLHSTPVTLGTVTTNSAGSGSGTFTIPSNTSAGTHTITVSDVSGNSGSATVVVTGATGAANPTSTKLPVTGSDAGLLSGIGAAAVCTGGIVVLAARKRRRSRFN